MSRLGEVAPHLLLLQGVQLLAAESEPEVVVDKPPRSCMGRVPDSGEFIQEE